MRLVSLGGGHGLARTLEAAVRLGYHPTAIVSVADNGGSTGRLRVDRTIPALGDLRHALQVLAASPVDRDWLAHRFTRGDLAGHAQGNLAILSYLETGLDLVSALARIGEKVDAQGTVLPCTSDNVHLYARDHGELLVGQVAVQHRNHPGPLDALWLEPPGPQPCREAIEAILQADVITLGPGSLLTSLAPILLVEEIAQAVAASTAYLLMIANTTTQPGETDGMGIEAQCQVLLDLIPGERRVDVLVHDGPCLGGPGMALGTRVNLPRVDQVHVHDMAVRPDEGVGTGHDERRLATALAAVFTQRLGRRVEANPA